MPKIARRPRRSSTKRAARGPRPRCAFRSAETADVPQLLPLMAAFNRHERIAFRSRRVERALRRLIADPALGQVLIAYEPAGALLGYAVLTYNYDLEFAGPDAFVTELFVVPAQRERGIARALLRALLRQMQGEQITAVHLVVRPGNARARRLYERLGFALVPRVMMTRVLAR